MVGILVIFGLLTFLTGVVSRYRVPSVSMEPTYDVGAQILVGRRGFPFGDPSRGDVVVVHAPQGALEDICGSAPQPGQACPRPTPQRSNTKFIKRIVAGPGDRLKIVAGTAYVNGKRQDEPFIHPVDCETCNLPSEIKIPDGYWFLLGDNRGNSDDSRIWGPVPTKWIIGRVIADW